jgi:hypothetical protein
MVSVNHGHLKEEKALEVHQDRRGSYGTEPGKRRRISSSTRKKEVVFVWLYIGRSCCVFTLNCSSQTTIDHSHYNGPFTLNCSSQTTIDHSHYNGPFTLQWTIHTKIYHSH